MATLPRLFSPYMIILACPIFDAWIGCVSAKICFVLKELLILLVGGRSFSELGQNVNS